eukprot:11222044-Lingulodinium_polyedra.AAC.1
METGSLGWHSDHSTTGRPNQFVAPTDVCKYRICVMTVPIDWIVGKCIISALTFNNLHTWVANVEVGHIGRTARDVGNPSV